MNLYGCLQAMWDCLPCTGPRRPSASRSRKRRKKNELHHQLRSAYAGEGDIQLALRNYRRNVLGIKKTQLVTGYRKRCVDSGSLVIDYGKNLFNGQTPNLFNRSSDTWRGFYFGLIKLAVHSGLSSLIYGAIALLLLWYLSAKGDISEKKEPFSLQTGEPVIPQQFYRGNETVCRVSEQGVVTSQQYLYMNTLPTLVFTGLRFLVNLLQIWRRQEALERFSRSARSLQSLADKDLSLRNLRHMIRNPNAYSQESLAATYQMIAYQQLPYRMVIIELKAKAELKTARDFYWALDLPDFVLNFIAAAVAGFGELVLKASKALVASLFVKNKANITDIFLQLDQAKLFLSYYLPAALVFFIALAYMSVSKRLKVRGKEGNDKLEKYLMRLQRDFNNWQDMPAIKQLQQLPEVKALSDEKQTSTSDSDSDNEELQPASAELTRFFTRCKTANQELFKDSIDPEVLIATRGGYRQLPAGAGAGSTN